MNTDYYVIVDGVQRGPMGMRELSALPLKEDMLVWRAGMADWKPAGSLEELAMLFVKPAAASPADDVVWYAMLNGRQTGPLPLETLVAMGLTASTPVWRPGMADWTEASRVPEVMSRLAGSVPPPHYGDWARQAPQTPWQQGAPGQVPFNWLPWAIVATVAGFLTSCIGAVFGIIAIINANKANTLYSAGQQARADQANSTAKTMTVLGLIFAGLGLIFTGLMFTGALGGFHLNSAWL